jgi:hypothetical protein
MTSKPSHGLSLGEGIDFEETDGSQKYLAVLFSASE